MDPRNVDVNEILRREQEDGRRLQYLIDVVEPEKTRLTKAACRAAGAWFARMRPIQTPEIELLGCRYKCSVKWAVPNRWEILIGWKCFDRSFVGLYTYVRTAQGEPAHFYPYTRVRPGTVGAGEARTFPLGCLYGPERELTGIFTLVRNREELRSLHRAEAASTG